MSEDMRAELAAIVTEGLLLWWVSLEPDCEEMIREVGREDAEVYAEALTPTIAGYVALKQAEAWQAGRSAKGQYLGPDDGHYPDCMGWNDCRCATYSNPYLSGGE